MPGLVLRNGWIACRRLAVVAEARVDARVLFVAVVRVDRVAGAAAGGAVVARLVARAEEPQVRIVQARLGDVDDGHRDAASRAGPAIRLANVGTAGLVEFLQRSGAVGQADLGKLRG